MREIVQNALNEARPISHERAWAFYSLLLNADKAIAWRRAHPSTLDPALQLLSSANPPAFTFPPIDWNPPEQYPAIALTPHGVAALADMLTRKLADQKLLKGAQDDVRACLVRTMREMSDQCNDAFVSRLRQARTLAS